MKQDDLLKIIKEKINDNDFLIALKKFAAEKQSFELAAQVRMYQKENFSEDDSDFKVFQITPTPEEKMGIDALHNTIIATQTGIQTLSVQLYEARNHFWEYVHDLYPDLKNYECTYSPKQGVITRLTKKL